LIRTYFEKRNIRPFSYSQILDSLNLTLNILASAKFYNHISFLTKMS